MTEFNALLKRSFAEAHEPADDGFTLNVARGVERREFAAKLRTIAQSIGLAAAGVAILYGAYGFVAAFGQGFLASAGLEIAQAHGALAVTGPSVAGQAEGLLQSMGAGLTQVLLITAALAGGAVAYRATQD